MTGLTVADRCQLLRWREMPRHRLLDLLLERGYGMVASRAWLSRGQGDPFQRLLIQGLLRGGSIHAAEPGLRGGLRWLERYHGKMLGFVQGPGGVEADAYYTAQGSQLRSLLLERLPPLPRPLMALDFSLLPEHLPEEASSLRRQTGAVLGAVRRYLWDRHLVLGSLEPGALQWLRAFLGSPHVYATPLPADEALTLLGAKRIILLDPSADKPLAPSEVLEADAFILGAIVDRVPRPGATRRLRLMGVYEPRRLELRGSIHGVPTRLNMLAETLLAARYQYCGDLEKAITSVMSPRDARWRAYIEISRWLRGRRTRVPWSLYCSLRRWLPLSPRDFIRAARMAGAETEPGPPRCPEQD